MNERWGLNELKNFLEASRGEGILTKHGGGKKNLELHFQPHTQGEGIQIFAISAHTSRQKLGLFVADFNAAINPHGKGAA